MVIGKLLAAGVVNAASLVCKHLAADHFILELGVGQLLISAWLSQGLSPLVKLEQGPFQIRGHFNGPGDRKRRGWSIFDGGN